MSEAEGRARLTAERLAAGQRRMAITGRGPSGTIVDQSPSAGALVPPGSPVNLVVEGHSARVPALRGQRLADALRVLEAAGLRAGTEHRVATRELPPGTVLRQDPRAGDRVPQGMRVDLWVAEFLPTAPPAVSVPDLRGLPLDEVEHRLRREGLRLGRVRTRSSGMVGILDGRLGGQGAPAPSPQAGRVLEQSPAAGAEVEPGTVVDVIVAGESPPPAPIPVVCTVPGVEELLLDAALARLEAAGLKGRVAKTYESDSGRVYRQMPPAGQDVPCGTVIDLVLGTIG
jgi:beta-lactam-binding protein with PASTA domain